VAVTIILFLRRDLWAGLMLVPYLGWIGFASVLTDAFRRLN
jgi:tryptophan-rich sensory protein